MTIEELINRIGEPLVAWHLQICMSRFTGHLCNDKELLKEGQSECFRSVFDTLREFEEECINRGKEEAAKHIAQVVSPPKGVTAEQWANHLACH